MTDNRKRNAGTSARKSSLVDVLQSRAREHPSKQAFTFQTLANNDIISLTYEQLLRRAMVIAAGIQQYTSIGDRVVLFFPSGLDFVAAFFGCLFAGAVAVPLAPPNRSGRNAATASRAAAEARPALILSTQTVIADHNRLLPVAPELAGVPWKSIEHVSSGSYNDWQAPMLDQSSLAMLQYTSGSTARPKGVMLSHGNLLHNSALICRCFGHSAKTRAVIWLPLYHDMGLIGGVIQPVYCGGSSALLPPIAFAQRSALWLETISRTRATVSGGPDFAFDLCTRRITSEQRQNLDLSSWEVAFCGAEPIRAETLERFSEAFAECGFRREAFLPCYGLAEATLIVSGGPRTATPTIIKRDSQAATDNHVCTTLDSAQKDRLFVGCGEFLGDQKYLIVDPELHTVIGGDSIGEIWIQGSSVGAGYHDQTAATAATFGAFTSDTGEGPFLRTGDLGFVHGRQLFVTGRLKDLMILHGKNHYPEDIEESIDGSYPGLRPGHNVAFSISGPRGEQVVIVAELEPRCRSVDTMSAIRAIRGAIATQHSICADIIVLAKAGSIPKTSSGKKQRAACRELFEQNQLVVVTRWSARTDGSKNGSAVLRRPSGNACSEIDEGTIQRWLQTTIASRLGVEDSQVETTTPFADLGLGSLEAVEITNELENFLGQRVSATAMYSYPTLSKLSAWLASRR